MSFSNAFETNVLTYGFTTGSTTRPTVWYVELYTVAPTDAGGGTPVTGGGYVRQAVTTLRRKNGPLQRRIMARLLLLAFSTRHPAEISWRLLL